MTTRGVDPRATDNVVDATFLLERGRRREEQGDDLGALADFESAIERAPGTDDPSTEIAARAGVVRLHLAAGHAVEVDAQLERIEDRLTTDPIRPIARAEALIEWGLVLIERGEDASTLLDEAFALATQEPTDAQALRVRVRALVYQAQAERLRGDYRAAQTTLERALSDGRAGPRP